MLEGYQKAINAPSLISSGSHTDIHIVYGKMTRGWTFDSAFQTTIMPCNHKTLCTEFNPKAAG